jgi:hypothetical protein
MKIWRAQKLFRSRSALRREPVRSMSGTRSLLAAPLAFQPSLKLRPRSKRIAGGMAACLLLSTSLAYPSSIAQVAEPGTVAAANLLGMLAARSPGERPEGAQPTKSKPERAPLARANGVSADQQRPQSAAGRSGVLPRMVIPSPGAPEAHALPDALAAIAVPPAPGEAIGSAAPLAAAGFAASPVGDIVLAALTPGAGGIGAGPGAGGGGAGGGSGATPPGGQPVVVTPVSAVPEPGTWLTMLLGFGLVGHAMRRASAGPSRRRAPVPFDSAPQRSDPLLSPHG